MRSTKAGAGARLLLATALVALFSMLAGPGTAYALGGIGPVVPISLPAGIGILEAVIPGGLTVGGAATVAGDGAVVASGGVIAGAVLVGGGLMYLSWKLGDQVGTALPCLDCGPSSAGIITHGCPSGGALVGSFAFGSLRCGMTSADGMRTYSTQRVAATWDRVCAGRAIPTGQGTVEDFWMPLSVYAYSCGAGVPLDAVILHIQGWGPGLDIHLGTASLDSGSPAGPGVPTGEALQTALTSTVRHADGTLSTVVTYGTPFHALDPAFPPIAVPALAAGDTRTSFGATVVGTASGTAVVPTTLLPTTTLPTTAPADRPDLSRCLPGGADYPCAMVLTLHLPGGATRLYDPSTDYKGGAVPDGLWDCTAGAKVVPVTDCSGIYKQVPRSTGTATPLPNEPTPDGGNCVASGVSFNPISWVYVPVKCALVWAFVPPVGTMAADFGIARSGFDATGLPAWGSALGGVGVGLAHLGDGAGGCAGPHFDISLHGHSYAFDPLNACSAPMSGVAVVVKLFASLAVLVAGARLCARPVMAAIGMGQAV